MASLEDVTARVALVAIEARARWLRRRPAARERLWPAPPPYRKAFVVGCPRSGTTWIRKLLGQHPQVVTGPESHAYPQIVGTFTDLGLGGRDAWRRVLARYDRGRRRPFEAGLHMWTDFRSLCQYLTAALATPELDDLGAAERMVEAILDAYFIAGGGTAGDLLLEKSPMHVHYVDRILARYPEARVVEVLRDGRDVCVSMEMRGKTQAWSPTERRLQIETWVSCVERGLAWRQNPAFADRILLLRYEDVHAAPVDQAVCLLDFLGLTASRDEAAAMLEAVAIDRQPRSGTGEHARRGTVGDWEAHFSAADRTLFADLAGDLSRTVGYDL